jgi:Domain of unknown function (DUF4338)
LIPSRLSIGQNDKLRNPQSFRLSLLRNSTYENFNKFHFLGCAGKRVTGLDAEANEDTLGKWSKDHFGGNMCAASVAKAFTADANLKRKIRRHFTNLGFTRANDGTLILPGVGKDTVRKLHSGQRAERLSISAQFLLRSTPKLLKYFANGDEIDPSKVELALIRIETKSEDAELFRLASMTWSVPVSVGFGRRLRYLVWDQRHGRLAGIVALGDPVFNLSVRDNLIGWDTASRGKRLVNVLDAYVLGAVPPYNMLLVGKAIACLAQLAQLGAEFGYFPGFCVA